MRPEHVQKRPSGALGGDGREGGVLISQAASCSYLVLRQSEGELALGGAMSGVSSVGDSGHNARNPCHIRTPYFERQREKPMQQTCSLALQGAFHARIQRSGPSTDAFNAQQGIPEPGKKLRHFKLRDSPEPPLEPPANER